MITTWFYLNERLELRDEQGVLVCAWGEGTMQGQLGLLSVLLNLFPSIGTQMARLLKGAG